MSDQPKGSRRHKKSKQRQNKEDGQPPTKVTSVKAEIGNAVNVQARTKGDNIPKQPPIANAQKQPSKTSLSEKSVQVQPKDQKTFNKIENKQSKDKDLKNCESFKAENEITQVKPISPVFQQINRPTVIQNNVEKVPALQLCASDAITDARSCSNTPPNEKLVANKQKSQDDSAPEKSKAELRAERRAIQEAQRAAKQGKKDDVKGPKISTTSSSTTSIAPKPVPRIPSKQSFDALGNKGTTTKPSSSNTLVKSAAVKQVKLFSHLPAYERNISVIQAAKDGIHPAVVQLGLQYAEGVVCGSNARCTALIYALLEVVRDFKTPESKDFSDALNSMQIEPSMKFLEKCRPVSVGMKVVCKKIKEKINELPKDLTEEEAKKQTKYILNCILEDDILKAHDAIVTLAKNKISADDVILTYGCSYLVKEVLTAAHQNAKFRVIVVDSRPKLEGKSMLRYLIKQGIECTYVLINAVAHVMQEVTKVFLGAHALLANGYVMSRVGSSQVALVAKAFNKPVLVCCETYKFSELVQTDSFVFNELGNPDDLMETHRQTNPLSDWQTMKSLNILNLYYDVTPPDLVTVIINDVHLVPCTSVPVLLRVKPTKK